MASVVWDDGKIENGENPSNSILEGKKINNQLSCVDYSDFQYCYARSVCNTFKILNKTFNNKSRRVSNIQHNEKSL